MMLEVSKLASARVLKKTIPYINTANMQVMDIIQMFELQPLNFLNWKMIKARLLPVKMINIKIRISPGQLVALPSP
jgi:hypothetical protein